MSRRNINLNRQKIIDDIVEYYYTYTELGQRERVLGLEFSEISLSKDFPHYNLGIRGLSNKSVGEVYTFYIDLIYFINYRESDTLGHNMTNYDLVVVSDEYNVYKKDRKLVYPNRCSTLSFLIDMSHYEIYFKHNYFNSLSTFIFSATVFKNWLDSNIKAYLESYTILDVFNLEHLNIPMENIVEVFNINSPNFHLEKTNIQNSIKYVIYCFDLSIKDSLQMMEKFLSLLNVEHLINDSSIYFCMEFWLYLDENEDFYDLVNKERNRKVLSYDEDKKLTIFSSLRKYEYMFDSFNIFIE